MERASGAGSNSCFQKQGRILLRDANRLTLRALSAVLDGALEQVAQATPAPSPRQQSRELELMWHTEAYKIQLRKLVALENTMSAPYLDIKKWDAYSIGNRITAGIFMFACIVRF
jgi:hypothetical protein